MLTPLLDPGVDRRLADLGYTAEGETATLYGDITALRTMPGDAIDCVPGPDDAWLTAMSALQGHSAGAAAVYRRVVEKLAVPAAFLRCVVDGEPVALAFGALHTVWCAVNPSSPRRRIAAGAMPAGSCRRFSTGPPRTAQRAFASRWWRTMRRGSRSTGASA